MDKETTLTESISAMLDVLPRDIKPLTQEEASLFHKEGTKAAMAMKAIVGQDGLTDIDDATYNSIVLNVPPHNRKVVIVGILFALSQLIRFDSAGNPIN